MILKENQCFTASEKKKIMTKMKECINDPLYSLSIGIFQGELKIGRKRI
jgi:hypothetical protein